MVAQTTDMTAESVPSIKVACLRVSEELYALDIMCIKEIIRIMPIIPVPKSPAFVDGVINLRNAVIPVIDLRRRFGLPSADNQEKKRRIIICAVDGRIVGLLADEVSEVKTCSQEDVRPAPYYMAGPEAEFFPGVCRSGDKLMMLINPRKLLASQEQIDMSQMRQRSVEVQEGS